MRNIAIAIVLAIVILAHTGCATSMTPSQFMAEFPGATKAEFYDRARAKHALLNNSCRLLVVSRSYAAPQGISVDEDLRNGARGVDEWVRVDGGNAFILNNFEWITTDQWGSTQLIVYFDTMLCETVTPRKIGA